MARPEPSTARTRTAGRSLIAAPTLLASGWIILLPSLGKGPTRAWTLAHYLLLSGFATFAPATMSLHDRVQHAAPVLAKVGAGCVLIVLQRFCKIGVPLYGIQHCKAVDAQRVAGFYRKSGTRSVSSSASRR